MNDTFLADCMVGRLCTWIRIIGADCAYIPEKGRTLKTAAAMAKAQGRIFLTRDSGVEKLAAPPGYLVFRSQKWREQLKSAMETYGLEVKREWIFSRCLLCNAALLVISRDEGENSAPPLTRAAQEKYYKCPSCGKIYWRGTHVGAVLRELRESGIPLR